MRNSKIKSKVMHPSASTVQKEIEKIVLKKLNLKEKKIKIDGIEFNFDGFCDKSKQIAEIYAGINTLKSAQQQKVSQDLLKMILYEKLSGKKYIKKFIVIDKKIYDKLSSEKSWKNRVFKEFDIKLEYVEIDEKDYNNLKTVKEKQNLLNQ